MTVQYFQMLVYETEGELRQKPVDFHIYNLQELKLPGTTGNFHLHECMVSGSLIFS